MPKGEQKSAREARAEITRRGDVLSQELSDIGARRRDLGEGYRRRGDVLYDELLETPGFMPGEEQALLQEEELGALGRGRDWGGYFLSPDEETEIRGDPWAAVRPLHEEFGWQREALGRGGEAARDSFAEGMGRLRRAAGEFGGGLRDIYSPGYERGLRASLASGGAAMRGSVAGARGEIGEALGPGLEASERYLDAMSVTPAEMDKMRQAGANVIRARGAAAVSDAERRAMATGNVNPIALGELRRRLLGTADVESADVALQGELAAQESRRRAEQLRETTRLGAGQARAGMRVGAATDLARLGMGAESELLGRDIDVTRDVAGRRADVERDIYAAESGAALSEADRAMALETGLTDREMEMLRQQQQFRSGEERLSEAAQQQRAAGLAANRQAMRAETDRSRYQTGLDILNEQARRRQQVFGARQAGRQEARGYFPGQSQFYEQQSNAPMQQRADVYGAQAGGIARTTETEAAAYRPGLGRQFGESLIRGAGQGLASYGTGRLPKAEGGIALRPTKAVIGESGPEVVIPLDLEPLDAVSPAAMRARRRNPTYA